jgi:hypothetical protein
MKTLFYLGISLMFYFPSHAQDNTNKVDQIIHIQFNSWDNTTDTIVEKYKYNDGKLMSAQITKAGKPEDLHTYEYEQNKIIVKNSNNRMIRSYTFDSDNTITEYWNDNCDKFSFSYNDGKIKSIDRVDKCDQYNEGGNFEYAGDKLSKVKIYIKSQPQYTTDYVFTYSGDTLTKIEWGNNIDIYFISWKEDHIAGILHSKFGNKDWRIEFDYKNANITEERYYTFSNGQEVLSDRYMISYSGGPANDSIVWNLYDWRINIFMNQRTYRKFVQMRY